MIGWYLQTACHVYFHEWMFHYSRAQHGWKTHQRCKRIWCDHLFPLVKKGGEACSIVVPLIKSRRSTALSHLLLCWSTRPKRLLLHWQCALCLDRNCSCKLWADIHVRGTVPPHTYLYWLLHSTQRRSCHCARWLALTFTETLNGTEPLAFFQLGWVKMSALRPVHLWPFVFKPLTCLIRFESVCWIFVLQMSHHIKHPHLASGQIMNHRQWNSHIKHEVFTDA